MTLNRYTTIGAGILIILGMVAGMLSVVPSVEEPDYLMLVSAHKSQVMSGAFFQFLMIPAYIGFALFLYPALRMVNETLSLGFLGARLITGMFHLLGVILLPLLLILSQEFVQAGAPAASHFQVLGEILRIGRDLVNHVAVILSLALGDLLLLFMLYQSRFIPRWLVVWGLVGNGLAMLASFLVLFRLIDVVTPSYLSLNVPLALHGFVLALWLIIKGFGTSAVASQAAYSDSSTRSTTSSQANPPKTRDWT